MSNDFTTHNYKDIINKPARRIGENTNFGVIKEIEQDYIIIEHRNHFRESHTRKAVYYKNIYHIPKDLIDQFDGNAVYLKITKDKAVEYKKDTIYDR